MLVVTKSEEQAMNLSRRQFVCACGATFALEAVWTFAKLSDPLRANNRMALCAQ